MSRTSKITSHPGAFIGPGWHDFHVEHVDVRNQWFHCVTETTREIQTVEVPDPGIVDGGPQRATFRLLDRQWTVVRDDDLEFWGGVTKEEFLGELRLRHIEAVSHGESMGWWDVDDATLEPRRKPQMISIQEMVRDNKTLMAHLAADLGIFKSVGEAKRNGWDRPLELGRHTLGPKKKRVTVELIP